MKLGYQSPYCTASVIADIRHFVYYMVAFDVRLHFAMWIYFLYETRLF